MTIYGVRTVLSLVLGLIGIWCAAFDRFDAGAYWLALAIWVAQ